MGPAPDTPPTPRATGGVGGPAHGPTAVTHLAIQGWPSPSCAPWRQPALPRGSWASVSETCPEVPSLLLHSCSVCDRREIVPSRKQASPKHSLRGLPCLVALHSCQPGLPPPLGVQPSPRAAVPTTGVPTLQPPCLAGDDAEAYPRCQACLPVTGNIAQGLHRDFLSILKKKNKNPHQNQPNTRVPCP